MYEYKIGLALVKNIGVNDKGLDERKAFIISQIKIFNEKSTRSLINPKHIGLGEKGEDDIQLTIDEIEKGDSISENKKELMNKLYETFKSFSAMDLVSFTHAKGSPWREVWENEPYGDISKESMKTWFSQYVKK